MRCVSGLGFFVFLGLSVPEAEVLERDGSTGLQEMVHEPLEQHLGLLVTSTSAVEVEDEGVDDGNGLPEVAPEPRLHAGAHDVARAQEGQDAAEDVQGEVVDPDDGARRLLLRHCGAAAGRARRRSVEQVARTKAAGTCKQA